MLACSRSALLQIWTTVGVGVQQKCSATDMDNSRCWRAAEVLCYRCGQHQVLACSRSALLQIWTTVGVGVQQKCSATGVDNSRCWHAAEVL